MNKYFFLFVDMMEVLDNQINCLYYLIYYARNLKPDTSSLLLLFRFPICISFKPKGEILKSKATWKAQKSAVQDQLAAGLQLVHGTGPQKHRSFVLHHELGEQRAALRGIGRTDAEKFIVFLREKAKRSPEAILL